MNNNKTFNFTANNIAQIPFSESQTEYFDASIKVPNSRLCLRVGKATKTWVLHYRKTANGKTKKVTNNLKFEFRFLSSAITGFACSYSPRLAV